MILIIDKKVRLSVTNEDYEYIEVSSAFFNASFTVFLSTDFEPSRTRNIELLSCMIESDNFYTFRKDCGAIQNFIRNYALETGEFKIVEVAHEYC